MGIELRQTRKVRQYQLTIAAEYVEAAEIKARSPQPPKASRVFTGLAFGFRVSGGPALYAAWELSI